MSRFYSPRPQFLTATPAVYSGAHLKFYISQTSTPKNVYSDAARSVSIGADLTLNSAGWYNGEIFLNSDSAYKVVLEDSAGSVIWTADPVASADYSTSAQFLTYAGNPNGNVAGTAGSGAIQSDVIWDSTNSILYVCTTSGVAAAAVWTAVNASATTPSVPHPQGRLTMTSATPVISTGVTAGTAIYYALYNGNLVPIYNGTSMVPTEFTELTLSLVASHTASSIYDVFVWSESGVLTLGTGPAWTTATAGSGARGTGAGTTQLTRVKGLWTNTVSMTTRNGSTTYTVAANRATYLGSIAMDGTNGQLSALTAYGQSRKFGVWNAYNRQPIVLQAGDATASWSYNTATIRKANNASANSLTTFSGLPDEVVSIRYVQAASITGNTGATGAVEVQIGIGVNSEIAYTGKNGTVGARDGNTEVGHTKADAFAEHDILPMIGTNTITALEKGSGGSGETSTFFGTSATMLLRAQWNG